MVEIRRVGITQAIGDLRDLPFALAQQGPGQFHALLAHVLQHRLPEYLAEGTAQGGFTHPEPLGQGLAGSKLSCDDTAALLNAYVQAAHAHQRLDALLKNG